MQLFMKKIGLLTAFNESIRTHIQTNFTCENLDQALNCLDLFDIPREQHVYVKQWLIHAHESSYDAAEFDTIPIKFTNDLTPDQTVKLQAVYDMASQ